MARVDRVARGRAVVVMVAWLGLMGSGWAGADGGLAITARIDLNPASIVPQGGGDQRAVLSLPGAGDSANLAIQGKSASGTLPATGSLEAVGDRITADIHLSATGTSAAGLLLDISVELANTTANLTYQLRLDANSRLSLTAAGGDAAIDAGIRWSDGNGADAAPPLALAADALFDQHPSPRTQSTAIPLELPPGTTLHLNGSLDLQGDIGLLQSAGDGDRIEGTVAATLTLAELRPLRAPGDPTPVPALNAWALALLGALLLLAAFARTISRRA